MYKNLCRSSHLTCVTGWISGTKSTFAIWQSISDHLVAACCALFRHIWYCLSFVTVTVSATSIKTSISVWMLWMFSSYNWSYTVSNCWSSFAFAAFKMLCSRKTAFKEHCIDASSSAMSNQSELSCLLGSGENWLNVSTALITISPEAVPDAVFRYCLEQARIAVYFNFSHRIMPQICLPCQELLFKDTNAWEKHRRSGYPDINLSRLTNWFLTIQVFSHLSRQWNKSWTEFVVQ